MKEKTELRLLSLLLMIFIVSASCRTDYKKSVIDEELEGTPDFVLYNFSETVVEKGVTVYHIKAETAEAYNKNKKTIVKNLYFAEYSSDNSISTEGTAGKAVYHSDNDNIIFEQDLELTAVEQGFYIKGDYLFWDSSSRNLTGSGDGLVTIGKEDGSRITGRGFRASAGDRSFSFEKDVEGKYVSDENE